MPISLIRASRQQIEDEEQVALLRACDVPEEQVYRATFYSENNFLVAFYLPEEKLLAGLLSKLQGLLDWSDIVISRLSIPIEFVEGLPDSSEVLLEMAS